MSKYSYDQYEDLICERIHMDKVTISALPFVEVLNDPQPPKTPKIYVIYNGSTWGDPENLGIAAQEETLNFEIFINSKTRRDNEKSIFSLSEAIQKRLLGWKIPGSQQPIYLSGFGYVRGLTNNWQYQMTFSFTRVSVQAKEEEQAPLIKEINTPIKIINSQIN